MGRLDLPVEDLKNPSGLNLSHFVSVPSVINYVMSTPTDKLVFPGRLVAPATAGAIARQHQMTGVPLEILTRNAIGACEKKKKKEKTTTTKKKKT